MRDARIGFSFPLLALSGHRDRLRSGLLLTQSGHSLSGVNGNRLTNDRTVPGVRRFGTMTTENPVCPDTEIWEPMETAPLDGTPVRVRKDDIQATVSWSDDVHTWVIGLATEPNLPDRILPWHPTSWAPVPGALK